MKIVIIGGTGLIGRGLARTLQSKGHDIVIASPSTGVDSVTGKGLPEALRGANVVVDVTNSPSFADDAVMAFFRNSTEHLLSAAKAADVSHFVALSIVNTDRIPDSGYLRAKHAQEQLIQAGNIPYTIVRATQFFEFLGAIADVATEGDSIYMPTAPFQPVAADDVVDTLAGVATSEPKNGIVDLAGPEAMSMAKFIQTYLSAKNDSRKVIPDANAKYFGAVLDKDGLAPAAKHISGRIRFADWMTSH
ncbi:MAG TPA: SDR family oxidoreductase [Hyphomicrobium sp.]|nr:SDR family oxidoreductase [Hyphomicrobium sp.]